MPAMNERASAIAFPPSRAAWLLVALLMIAYVFSYTDRVILSILVEPIKEDLSLTDFQIGLLLGPAFAIFYATMGLPFGWLADRYRRTWIIGGGFLLWSLATVASGLARNFTQLFAARMSVGVGEATLSPCAMSLIADSFPRERRGKPIAVYSMGIVLGSSVAFLMGAFVLGWTRHAELPALPVVGALEPWQVVFLAIGAAGLLPALPFLVMREPRRMLGQSVDASLEGKGMTDVLRYVGRNWKVYASFMTLICLMTTVAYAGYWNPAMFDRTFGWSGEKYSLINGIVTLPVGLPVYWIAGWLSDRYTARGNRAAPLTIVIVGTLIMLPLYTLTPLMPDGTTAFIVLTVGGIGIMAITAVSVTALLNITPAAIRGQMVALYYMTMSLCGLFVGPTTVGFLSQQVYGEDRLNLALASVPVIYGIIPVLLIPITRRLYNQHMARLSVEIDEAAGTQK
ncbi:MAG: MFS transporter [Woeseiaceae bacterium]|nr:MFS transporter [Woeseiaceae bacterium]